MTNLLLGLPLYLFGAYLLFNVLYLLVFALAGCLRVRPQSTHASGPPRRMCVLMPTYRADVAIRETAPVALRHAYVVPVDVCVIADGLQPATVQALRAEGIIVVEVSFVKSTKGQALRAALAALPAAHYDVAVVLDVDNVMGDSFLTQVNAAFDAGYRVVQGHRTFKNLDSPFAVLDACNEEINNHIFRLGHARLGMSSSLIGSGMAFEYGYLQQLLHNIGETAGEDKEIDFRILRDHVKIAYLPEAFVYDEKIASAAIFGPQRTRWMAAQKEFLVKYFAEGFVQAGRGNWEFFDKILQTSLLPRVLLLGVLGMLLLSSLVLPFGPAPLCWAALLGGTGAALLLALPRRLYSWQVLRAAAHLPVALGAMALALLQLKKAKHSFLPTPHVGGPASIR